MKKVIIAGAASVALAAMPIMGVFATDDTDVMDTIKVTVEPSCTFRAQNSGTLDGTYTATGANGADVTPSISGGTNVHTFNVFCNNNKGYTVSAVAQDLANIDSATPAIEDKFVYKADLSGLTTTSGWHAAFAASTSGLSAAQLPDSATTGEGAGTASGTIMTRTNSTTATAGDAWTATYTAKIGSETKAGNYQGTITYTLAATPVSSGSGS